MGVGGLSLSLLDVLRGSVVMLVQSPISSCSEGREPCKSGSKRQLEPPTFGLGLFFLKAHRRP